MHTLSSGCGIEDGGRKTEVKGGGGETVATLFCLLLEWLQHRPARLPLCPCAPQHLVDINQPWDEAVFGKPGMQHDIVCQSSDRTDRNMSLKCRAATQPDRAYRALIAQPLSAT
ncbi:unnamed protein product [Arctogadus glacialis]